ncbi:hypothetical protein FQN57_006931 [Myotisia sp. PD_48]|nr:hypothetical protein FQN57_006931 [Myotisia sp. PD_48]
MEQAQSRALEALQPFVHLANSSTSHSPRFVANLITNATSAPNVFIFSELLETNAVQSLSNPNTPDEYRPYLLLLQLFSWGTWEEYCGISGLPTLNDQQSLKLRLLSIATLSTTHNPLTYPILIKSLGLKSHIELESLVTKANYSSLISARLSPTTNPATVNVLSVAPLRDVRPQAVETMIPVLLEWEYRCQTVVNGIEAEISRIKADARNKHLKKRDRAFRFDKSLAGWDGGEDGDGNNKFFSGGGATSDMSTRRSGRFSKDSGSGGSSSNSGRRLFGGASSKGNKRAFNATGHKGAITGSAQMPSIDGRLEGMRDSNRDPKRLLGAQS